MSRIDRRNTIKTTTVEPGPAKPQESSRDFIEQIVVAVILAIVIRGYDAEAFVIPTGSMAPTLMGRHKEVACPQCGLTYAINASEDSEQSMAQKRVEARKRLEEVRTAKDRLPQAEAMRERAARLNDPSQVEAATDELDRVRYDIQNAPRLMENLTRDLEHLHEVGLCVNCRYQMVVDDEVSFKGDRILVTKFPYELPFLPGSAGPKRWDVVVFHYPITPETNFIKRMVGLPGEELQIRRGDLLARPTGSKDAFRILRKPAIHRRAMQILVHDDAHRPKLLEGKPDWRRWNPSGLWKEAEAGRFRVVSEDGANWSDLRYRNILPDSEQWAALQAGSNPGRPARPTLITDFYSYNSNPYGDWLRASEGWLQSNWVGDLALACRVVLESAPPGGMLRLELVEAGVVNRCEVDLVTGMASLYHGEAKLGEASCLLKGSGSHEVEFANIDDQLSLSVDGEEVFLDGLPYDDAPDAAQAPNALDLEPAGLAIKGAGAVISGLVLKRDIYYTQYPGSTDFPIPGANDGFGGGQGEFARVLAMFDFLADPARFAALKDISTRETYEIQPDHYMMMGDNSPRSSDSRAWSDADRAWRAQPRATWEVPRTMLIGKAFFVYWPHGKPFGPDLRPFRNFRVPFRPYFERMKWIR